MKTQLNFNDCFIQVYEIIFLKIIISNFLFQQSMEFSQTETKLYQTIETGCDSKSNLKGTIPGTIPFTLGSLDSTSLNLSPLVRGLSGTLPSELLRSIPLTVIGQAWSPVYDQLRIPAIPCKQRKTKKKEYRK